MTTDTETAKAKAEALFRRQHPEGADKSRQADAAAKLAEAEKTARLRALRLAKEQSDQIAAEVRKARRQR